MCYAVGNSNGVLKGRRYFQVATNHGVFVKPGDVICVTGRKVLIHGDS
jgi:dynactin complex subunit